MLFLRITRRKRLTILKCLLAGCLVSCVIFWIKHAWSVPENSLTFLRNMKKENANVLKKMDRLFANENKLSYKSSDTFYDGNTILKSLFKVPRPVAQILAPENILHTAIEHGENQVPLKSEVETYMNVTPGLGENGAPVFLSEKEQKLADEQFNSAAFNVYISDRIALNRSVPDPRNPLCKYVKYDKDLPTASVVIIFTNEAWSALLRTIESVVDRTPAHLLQEIILVDDFSDKEFMKHDLQKYVKGRFPKSSIRVHHLESRQGLIRARLAGAKMAIGDVLVFLDSHCETNELWLEPLLQRIKEERTAVLCPIIDVIDDKTFEYYANNKEYFQIGGFTWSGHFTWIEIPKWEEERKKSPISPTRSPTMAGGLFAIDRNYFWEIGSYDSGMDIWGGENLEMSFRVWLCSGTLEIVPCSHVGHIFRSFHPYAFPGNKDTHGINTVRTVEVWMDEYKKYFYMHRQDLKDISYGDITERMNLKKELNCQPFSWYLQNIYPQKFVLDRNVSAYGSVRNPISNLCLDMLNRDEDKTERLGLYHCKASQDIVMNQMFSLSDNLELRREENCAEIDNNNDDTNSKLPVLMTKCHGNKGDQEWIHHMGGQLIHKQSGKCLDAAGRSAGEDVYATYCNGGHSQLWWFETYKGLDLNVKPKVM